MKFKDKIRLTESIEELSLRCMYKYVLYMYRIARYVKDSGRTIAVDNYLTFLSFPWLRFPKSPPPPNKGSAMMTLKAVMSKITKYLRIRWEQT